MWKQILILVATVAFAGCGKVKDTSSVQGIVTDLDRDNVTERVYAYFIEGRNIVRTECLSNEAIIRRNCFLNRKPIPYATFKRELDAGLAASVDDMEDKVFDLNAAVSRIHSRIGDTLALLEQREREEGGLSAQVRAAREDIARFEYDLAGYREELQMIDERLAAMDHVGLRAQRLDMADEMQTMQAQLQEISDRLPAMNLRLNEISLQIALLREEVGPAHRDLQQLNRELEVTTLELAVLKNDLRNYDETIEWLEESFSVRILADQSDRFSETRPFVRRFKTIFDARD